LINPKSGFIIPNMGTRPGKPHSSQRAPKKPVAPTGVADALFTKVQQRVLAVLFGNPGRSFYANEVITLAGSGTGAVQRELMRLESAGLATVTRVGRQKHYQANAAAPVFEELRGLVLKTSGLAAVLQAALKPLAGRIAAAFVFGSVAKGSDTARSDIDLMVLSESLSYADLFATLESATQQLGRTVNPVVYSRKEFDKRMRLDNAYLKRVISQPKIWVIGNENDLSA
jgi:predicted nucleotidyltransferase